MKNAVLILFLLFGKVILQEIQVSDVLSGDDSEQIQQKELETFIQNELISLPSYVAFDESVVQISAGGYHTLALTGTGKVYQWGIGSNERKEIVFPQDVNISTIKAGDYHNFAISTDGQLYSWGRNKIALGYMTNEDTDDFTPKQVGGSLLNKKVVKVSSGLDHSIAITDSGKIYSFGSTKQGQTGIISNYNSEEQITKQPVLIKSQIIKDKKIIDGCCGSQHTLLLTEDGQVYSFGGGSYGKLGTGNTTDSVYIKLVDFPSNETIKKISCGGDHNIAISNNNNLYSWGWNGYGQLGLGDADDRLTPTLIPLNISNDIKIKLIEAGKYAHSLLVTSNGRLMTWGWNEHGQLGFGDIHSRYSPVQVPGIHSLIDISSGYKHTVTLDNNGVISLFGDDLFGQLASSYTTDFYPKMTTGNLIYSSSLFDLTTTQQLNNNKLIIKQIQNERESMEDVITVIDQFGGNENDMLIAVYDGHGASNSVTNKCNASNIVAQQLPLILLHELKSNETIENKIMNCYYYTELQLSKSGNPSLCGTTAVTLLLTKNETYYTINTANIGDSLAYLYIGEEQSLRKLTYAHRASDRREQERLIAANSTITNNRVKGILEVTRSFGDSWFDKNNEIISAPYVSQIVIPVSNSSDNNNNNYLIVASDGLWDGISEEKILQWLNEPNTTLEHKVNHITEHAVKNSKDNISVVLLEL